GDSSLYRLIAQPPGLGLAAPPLATPEPGRRFQNQIGDPLLRQLYDYWQSKRGGRAMPRRADINPAEIPKLLPHMMITEILEGGQRYRYRLSGTAVSEAFGRELTGRYVDEVMTGAYREFIEGLYRTIYQDRLCIFSASQYANGKQAGLTTKRLLAPLSDDGSTVNQVLAVQTFRYAGGDRNVVVVDSMASFDGAGMSVADLAAGK